jgi:hypothetical protein
LQSHSTEFSTVTDIIQGGLRRHSQYNLNQNGDSDANEPGSFFLLLLTSYKVVTTPAALQLSDPNGTNCGIG